MASFLSSVVPTPWAGLQAEIDERLSKAAIELNEFGYDPYGFHPATAGSFFLPFLMLYRNYFRVETFDIGNVPRGRVLLIGNHAGQFAYDAAMLTIAMLMEADPPRICRGMAEYFLFRLPFVGSLGSRVGMMVGTPDNCVHMLENEQCVMAFPEGARGANKPFHKRYQLQAFGQGFMRLALESDTPIVPVGIVGSEEQQPGIANLEDLGRSLSLPSFPITLTSPWFGPLGNAMALPVKYRIYFGEPIHFAGSPNDEDSVIQGKVDVVKASMRGLLARGLRERSGIFS